ncbi:MAG: 3-deoxy-7-phosphoheptulonate synthase [Bdellovibrionaceae bacterium]|nr:3-deoxy-7-phosphoheptulonate synthase [Pseudobdellovibrionaceae bacterium]
MAKAEDTNKMRLTSQSPSSWKFRPIAQAPEYADVAQLREVEAHLQYLPGLVGPLEVQKLHERLEQVGLGNSFLLQGGDCAESFATSEELHENVLGYTQLTLELATLLSTQRQQPVVKVGRIAGQFAKPRSHSTESREGKTLPVYRGDLINGFSFDAEARKHDPLRMKISYFQSLETLKLLRDQEQVRRQEFFSSHEALLLNYEESLLRFDPQLETYYSSSAHMLWVGERTRQLEGAHVQFLCGISNPIGVKVGPEMKPEELIRLIERLNPNNQMGRLTLITRLGAKKCADVLPALIRKVRNEGKNVIWCCDPMHGNTWTTAAGFKTRTLEDILCEARIFRSVLLSERAIPGGLHLEYTSKNVVECVHNFEDVHVDNITSCQYETLCDPRLNTRQALELITKLGHLP